MNLIFVYIDYFVYFYIDFISFFETFSYIIFLYFINKFNQSVALLIRRVLNNRILSGYIDRVVLTAAES